jgi:hypothetical protein
VLACLLVTTTGCARFWAWIDNCMDFPRGAIPRPNGAAMDETFANQAAKAEAEDFVIHEYEWRLGTAELDFSGAAHLDHLWHRLTTAPYPVVIARTCDPGLDESRRATVIAYLASKLPPSAVEMAPPAELIPPGFSERSAPPTPGIGLSQGQELIVSSPLDATALAQRVIIGFPYAEGLQGEEAARIAPGAVGLGRGTGTGGQVGTGASGFSGAAMNVGTFNFR